MDTIADRLRCGETVPIKKEYQKIFKDEMSKRKVDYKVSSIEDGKIRVTLSEKIT
jgi:hypothetical protein